MIIVEIGFMIHGPIGLINKMNGGISMKKIRLASLGSIIISIFGSVMMSLLVILIFIADNFNIFGLIASILVLNLFLFVLYLCIFNVIVVNDDYLVVWKFKKIPILRSQIIRIFTSEDNFENIIYIETKLRTYKISGKSTVLGIKNNKKQTKKIIDDLCKIIDV